MRNNLYKADYAKRMDLKTTAVFLSLKPILHGLFNAGSTRGGGGRDGHKVSAAFFYETVKSSTIKLSTQTN